MQLIFIRHTVAERESQAGDEGRKLTREGTQQAKTIALALKSLNVGLKRILTSPLLRTAETAAIIAHELKNVPVEETPSLTPPGDGTKLRQQLAELLDEEVACVGLVGHSPSLDELLAEIIADTRRVGLSFTKGGAAMVELPVEEAPNGAILHWLLTYEQLAALAPQAVHA